MSIFDNNSIGEMNDEMVDRFYRLEWDFMRGKRIKKGLYPREIKDLHPEETRVYYNPGYVFYRYLAETVSVARRNARLRGEFNLSKLDEANLRVQFSELIKECKTLQYKSNTYIDTDLYDVTAHGLKTRIIAMMYNYITKETVNSKHFKK
jgi:hypothetical protein